MKTEKDLIESKIHIKKQINTEQLKQLYRNLVLSVPANFICASLVFISLIEMNNTRIYYGWFGAVIIISLLRLLILFLYYLRPTKESIHLFTFIVALTISSLLWGVLASFLMPKTLLQQMLIITVIAGVTSGGVPSLNANLTASLIFISAIIAPLCAWLFLQEGLTYFLLSIAMSIYLVFMLSLAFRSYKLLIKSLTLYFENQVLVDNLSDVNRKLVLSRDDLQRHELDMRCIHQMNEFLQTSSESNDAYTIIISTARKLFKDYSGGLAIFDPIANNLKIVRQWGDKEILSLLFTKNECWSLRTGNKYFVKNPTLELTCQHFTTLPCNYVCIPLFSQNGSIGLLAIYSDTPDSIHEYQVELASTLAEVVQLSLTNISLRENLYDQAIHDPLTRLYNRRYLNEILANELRRIARDKNPLCVAMLDLDHFKSFNDKNGHEAGDVILRQIGIMLNDAFRGSDVACRFGGEEFLLVLAKTDIENAYNRLEHFRESVKNQKLRYHDNYLPQVTISIGLAEAPKHGTTAQDIIYAADQALYTAKKAGRDRCEKFNG